MQPDRLERVAEELHRFREASCNFSHGPVEWSLMLDGYQERIRADARRVIAAYEGDGPTYEQVLAGAEALVPLCPAEWEMTPGKCLGTSRAVLTAARKVRLGETDGG